MYLTIKEIAKRLKLTPRHIARLASDEGWEYRQGKTGREYALTSVAVHHTQIATTENNPPAPIKQKSAWQQATKKAQDQALARLKAVELARQHPKHKKDIAAQANTSTRSLQRWINMADAALKKAYREGLNPAQTQAETLLPQYGQTRGKSFSFCDEAVAWAIQLYANQSKLNLSQVYYHLQNETRIQGWKIGSYSSLERIINRALSPSTQIAAREGHRKWKAACGYKILRNYEEIWPNFMWVGDHHIFDVFVMCSDGRPRRPWITAWTDRAQPGAAGEPAG